MRAREAIEAVARHRGDAIAVCALGMAANEWWAVTEGEDAFYMHGAMGFAASFALGLALSLPNAPVWLINADGSLCMNLGCLLTEAGQQPRNMKHFVVDNQCYQTVETMPMVNQDGADYTMMARGAGFQRAITIDNLKDLDSKMPEIVAAPGPYFIRLRIEAEPDYQRTPPATYEGPELKYRFGRAMEKKLGIKVFGPRGF
jgi:thiamine pyrophosphate-dependent acetolactate synthase large subunit-like protein